MRPKSENPEGYASHSAVEHFGNSAVSVAVSPLDAGISGIDPATPYPPFKPSEADIARSHLQLANAARRCAATRAGGRPCGSPAMSGDAHCYHHRARRAEADAVRSLPRVTDAASFQRALQQVLSDTYSGRLRARTAGQLLYGLQIASATMGAGLAGIEEGGETTTPR